MAELIYSTFASLDGYVNDAEGEFNWGEPDEEVHRHVNDALRDVGTYLFGRRLYEVMTVWETPEALGDLQPYILDFAEIWQAADKVVYSTTLEEVSTARTRIERRFDPEAVRRLKEDAKRDLAIGGPTLAAEAFRAGLIDEVRLYLAPIVVGGGTRALPDGIRQELELLDERRFAGGTVFVRYRARG